MKNSVANLFAIMFGVVTIGMTTEQPQIDWLLSQQDPNTMLMRSFEDDPAARAYTFDQAMAVIALTEAGELARARSLLDTMSDVQVSGPSVEGAWCEQYNSTNGIQSEWKYVSGPIAWMVIAINFYEARTADTNYAEAAELALAYLDTMRINNPGSETNHALRFSNYSDERDILSTEHNIDAYSAYLHRGLLSTNDAHLVTASNILDYLRLEMWAPSTNSNSHHQEPIFWGGWGSWLTNDCGSSGFYSINTDVQAWAVLALGPLGPNQEQFYRCVEWINTNRYQWGITKCTQDFSPEILGVVGFMGQACENALNGGTHHIHVDFTEHVAAAARRVGHHARAVQDEVLQTNSYALADFLHSQMARTKSTNGGLPYTFCFPQRPDPHLNNRTNYVASVVWHYLNERWINPFVPTLPPIRIKQDCSNCAVEIGWETVDGRPYKVQWRANLDPSAEGWHDLIHTNGNGGPMWVVTPIAPGSTRFFRVVLGE